MFENLQPYWQRCIFPAVLSAAEERGITGKKFMNALLVGYEVGIRAGILSHQLRPDYHCTESHDSSWI
ncbi:hypothetical protein [Ammoniphilus sp. 3BR4]|uniref:hypothetical protein n=1 Tax=Ammoniphilus sp. 3BR4 TaxID=3158265 RepID=UPI003465612B